MLFGLPILSLVIWVPIVAGVVVLATGSDRNAGAARWLALAGALLGLLVALPLWNLFDPAAHGPSGLGRIERTVTLESAQAAPLELRMVVMVTP